MMKILLDTNIILDIALERRDFYQDSKKVLLTINNLNITPHITATTVTDIYYILKKSKGHELTIAFLKNLFAFIDIIDVNKESIINALNSEMQDFEDAIQCYSAKLNNINIIVTRNTADFKDSKIDAITPLQFVKKH